jgi:hypothetical protein
MKLVDLGGAHGSMVAAIAKQYPGIRCTCLDLPSASQAALNTFRESGVADRCDFLGGDFFVEVPAGADAYLISGVLHNWGDGQCLKILRNCRHRVPDEGRLSVVYIVLSVSGQPRLPTAEHHSWV